MNDPSGATATWQFRGMGPGCVTRTGEFNPGLIGRRARDPDACQVVTICVLRGIACAASRFQFIHVAARTIGRGMLSWPSCEKTNVISDWSAQ
jgi:hypothetical protein